MTAERSRKRRRDLEHHDGERLAKAFAKTPGRAGMASLQLEGEVFQLGLGTQGVVDFGGLAGVPIVARSCQPSSNSLVFTFLRQVIPWSAVK